MPCIDLGTAAPADSPAHVPDRSRFGAGPPDPEDVAQQAARAGADALSPDSLRGSPTGLTASPAAAQAAANRVLERRWHDIIGRYLIPPQK